MKKNRAPGPTPPGWYPNPATGTPGYWDGAAWSVPPAHATNLPFDPATPQHDLQQSEPRGAGLTPLQEIVDVDVPAHRSKDLHAHIMQSLSQKPTHRIVTMTMATYGEFPLFYRVLIVIEYLNQETQ